MIKFSICVLFLLIIGFTIIIAQEDEEEPQPPKRTESEKVGGGGGFTPFWLFFDVDPLNNILAQNKFATLSKNGILLYGGGGYAYILLLPNLRVGGMGAGGSLKSKSFEPSTNMQREAELSIGFGGVTIDYVFPIFYRLDIVPGIFWGCGGMDLILKRNRTCNKDWNILLPEFGNSYSSTSEFTRKFSGTFFVYQPSINIEYALLRWVGLRIGISYNGMSKGSWELDDEFDIINVPTSINGKGWMLNMGIFVGTFLY